jgi:hypothetical protein
MLPIWVHVMFVHARYYGTLMTGSMVLAKQQQIASESIAKQCTISSATLRFFPCEGLAPLPYALHVVNGAV